MKTRRMKNIPDWRDEKLWAVTAYFTKKLRPNDYKIIHSTIICHLLLIGFGIAVGTTNKNGACMAFGLWHLILLAISL